jgi:hypothetical protein
MPNAHRFTTWIVAAGLLLGATVAFADPAIPTDACKYLSAERFGAIMKYSVTASPGPAFCTYTGSGSLGGQFRILAHAESPAAAEAALKRMASHGPTKPPGGRISGTTATSGSYVFSIYESPVDEGKLSQLVTEIRRNLK